MKQLLSQQRKVTAEYLRSLGLQAAAKQVENIQKQHIAYQNFDFLPKAKLEEFNMRLREKRTLSGSYQQVVLTPLEEYSSVPPLFVLEAIEKVQALRCFDSFVVAHMDEIKVPDPIVYGQVDGCSDLFFIAQWDNDISHEQLVGESI